MRTIHLLRHAHAEDNAASGKDSDRALSAHGLGQAQAAALWLAPQLASGAKIISSPARRTQQTAEPLLAALADAKLELREGIYDATPADLIQILLTAPSASVLVGHNPGLERLLALLTHGDSIGRGMTTASIATLEVSELGPNGAVLRAFWSP